MSIALTDGEISQDFEDSFVLLSGVDFSQESGNGLKTFGISNFILNQNSITVLLNINQATVRRVQLTLILLSNRNYIHLTDSVPILQNNFEGETGFPLATDVSPLVYAFYGISTFSADSFNGLLNVDLNSEPGLSNFLQV